MKPALRTRLPVLLVAFSLLAAAPVGVGSSGDLGFHPGAQTVLSKTFQTEGSVALDAVEILMNGQDMDPEAMGLPSDVEAEFGYDLDLADEYVSVAGGRPTELLRTFSTIEGWFIDPEGTEKRRSGDELTDKTVRFQWDEDAEAYERSFVDGDGDEEELRLWGEDLDLRALLPAGAVKEGETWDLSGDALAGVLVPGLNVEQVLEAAAENDAPEEILDAVGDLLAGATGTCTFEGLEETEDGTFAVIAMKATLAHDMDFDPEAFGADMSEAQLEHFEAFVALDLELEGRCLWDLAGGHFHSFDLEGTGTLEVEFAMAAAAMGMDLAGSAEFSFALESSAAVE